MAHLRSPADPDTRVLTAADAGRKLRAWQAKPKAAVRLAGKLGERFEALIRLFEAAAHTKPPITILPMETVIVGLFGAGELEAADATASWRKFVQLLRTEFEDLECPLDIDFHKGKGSLRDRGVWVRETLSESQRLTEIIADSPHLLPGPSDRYPEAHFVEPTLAVPAIGRAYPAAIDRFLRGCRGSEKLEAWPRSPRNRLRFLGASLRPIFGVERSPQPPLVGFWLEPTDRGGTWPEAILPSDPDGPVDAGRWFAAAWLAAAAETVSAMAALAREKGQAGLRALVHFPAGWTPDYADVSKMLLQWPELQALLTFALGEPKPEEAASLLKAVRRGWPKLPVAASERAITKWNAQAGTRTQENAWIWADAAECAGLVERIPESLADEARGATLPLLLVPKAENPDKAAWSVWLSETFAGCGWPGRSLVVGDSVDVAWDELVALGAQGRGGRSALRAVGPDADVAAVLEHLTRAGWQWKHVPLIEPDQGRVFEIGCDAAGLTLIVNANGEFESLNEARLPEPRGRRCVVFGRPMRLWRIEGVSLGYRAPRWEPEELLDDLGMGGTARSDRPRRYAEPREREIPVTHCPDLASLDRFLDGLQRAHATSNPFDPHSGVGRQEEYAFDSWEDLVFQDNGAAVGRLLEWAKGQGPRSAVILGEYGSGKTFLCRVFCSVLARERLRWAEAGPVPVYIDLRDVPLPSRELEFAATAQAVLRQALSRLQTREQNDAACQALREAAGSGLILLVLDGFDEIAARLDSHNGERLLRELLGLAGQNGRLLLSSRTHWFESRREEDRQFGGENSSANRDGRGEILRLYVQPFTEPQILGALEKRLGHFAANEAMAFIDQIHNLPELARRPVLLDMIARSLDRIRAAATGGRVLGAVDLYDAFIQEWLERDKTKSVHGYQEKRRQMGRMAITLWREGQEQGMPAEQLPDWLQEQLTGIRYDERDLLTTNLRTANFLVRDAEGRFRFAHRSFWEYFLAAGLLDDLVKRSRVALDGPRLGPEVVAFLISLTSRLEPANQRHAGETLVRLLADGTSREAAANAVVVLAHWQRTSPASAPMPKAGAQLAGVQLEGADLRNLRLEAPGLEGADLSRAVLDRARLPGAVLREARLFRTSLVDAVLEGVVLHGAELDLTDATRTDFRRSRGRGVVLSGPRLVACKWDDADWEPVKVGSPLVIGPAPASVSTERARNGKGHFEKPWFVRSASELAVAFSPDGRRLVSGSDDNTLRVWDAESGACLRILQGHENGVMSVAFSPDGRRLVSGSDDKTLRVWDAESGACLRTLQGHENWVLSVAFSPDGRRLVSGSSDKTLRVWDAESGACLRTLQGHENGVWSVAFSPDGRRLVSGSSDKTLRVWDAESGACLRTLQGHENGVWSVAFSPDGRRLVSGSSDKTLRVWDAESGACLRTLQGHENGVMSVAFSPDGRRLVSGSDDNTLRVWDAESGACLRTLQGHENGVMSVAFSPDGRRLVSGSDDNTLRVWDAESGACLRTLQGHENGVMSVAFSPDGRRLVSGSDDNTLRVWDAESGACLRTLQGHENGVMSVAFSPDGRRLVSGSDDNTLRVWDAESGACLRTLQGHENMVLSVAFSPDGRRLVSGSSDKTLRVWAAESGACLRTLQGHENWVWSVAFSPDGRRLVSGSSDKTLRVWDAESGACLRTLQGHENGVLSVAFSPDGRRLVSGSSDKTLRVWDAESGACLRTLQAMRTGS